MFIHESTWFFRTFLTSQKLVKHNTGKFFFIGGTSSIGRALASHARGTGIDARVLQVLAMSIVSDSQIMFHGRKIFEL